LDPDDGFSVWLNGELLAQNYNVWRGVTIDQERMPTRLRRGPNVLMVKIVQGRWGAWGFWREVCGPPKGGKPTAAASVSGLHAIAAGAHVWHES